MDLNRIKRKIREGRYQNISGITSDIRLLATNARKYNADGSELYNDSIMLEEVWRKIVELAEATPSGSKVESQM
uniref:Bromo domain-containing protein n=1 Tax=Steinernema glaseri TaxID=37863 RepID=A0A1I8A3V5_9BILA